MGYGFAGGVGSLRDAASEGSDGSDGEWESARGVLPEAVSST